jgi:hypothetical protein
VGGCEFAQSSGSTHVMPLLLSKSLSQRSPLSCPLPAYKGQGQALHNRGASKGNGASQTKSRGQEVFDLGCWDPVVSLQGKDRIKKDPF